MADWQSLDPEAAREAEKYDNPIPSRELILQRLADRGEPAAREELAKEFGLYEEDQIEALRRRLRAMERDGQLIYCLLYTSPSPRDVEESRMPSSA